MKIYNDISQISKKGLFVTAGVFDGLHLGHRHILKYLVENAKKQAVESAVITFWPHPLTVVLPDKNVELIDTIDEKIELIKKQGIDNLILLPFTKELSSLSAKEFMQKYLKESLNIRGLVIGYDHKFGRDQLHDFNVLSQYAKELGFDIKKSDAFIYEQETISSTLIRKAIKAGKIERANTFLSRNFALSGKVVGGHRIGRKIGFPTANIQLDTPCKIIPKEGVYAVNIIIDKMKFEGMLNIGLRPTFNSNISNKTIEVHIFDFNNCLYDKNITIEFCKRIRDEMKFDGVQQLVEQLRKDETSIRHYFKELYTIY